MSAPQYQLTRRGRLVVGLGNFLASASLGIFGGYLVATWFGLRG